MPRLRLTETGAARLLQAPAQRGCRPGQRCGESEAASEAPSSAERAADPAGRAAAVVSLSQCQ